MPDKPTNPLAEIRSAHLLCTHSAPRPGGINVNKAGCSCGARYEWYRREAEHAEHVDAAIVEHFTARIADAWDEGVRQQRAAREPVQFNPYRAIEETP